MIRKILGAVAGYVVYFLTVFLLFTGFSVALGPDRLFQAGNYDPTVTWGVGALVIGVIAAVIGGYVAAWIGQRGAVKIMVGIVVLIGVLVFLQSFGDHSPAEPRTVELPVTEAMFKAREPLWVASINPILLTIAVFAGGALRRKHADRPQSRD
jgi:uncharacterized membrane protein YfcA